MKYIVTIILVFFATAAYGFDYGIMTPYSTSAIMEIPSDTSVPGTCNIGELFLDTDSTAGIALEFCQDTNTWKYVGEGVFIQAGDVPTNETDPITGAVSGVVCADGGGNISACSNLTDVAVPSASTDLSDTADLVRTSDAGTEYLQPGGDGSGLSGVVTAETDPIVGAINGIPTADGGGNISAAASSDVIGLFASGSCSGYLKSDGDCDTPAGGYTDLTQFVDQTAWRVFYSNTDGDVTELALGADGTFLKSNGASSAPTFAVPAGSGDVSKVGTPVDNQVGVWTGDGTIEGTAGFTYDGSNLLLTGDIGATGTRITKGWFADLQGDCGHACTGAKVQ